MVSRMKEAVLDSFSLTNLIVYELFLVISRDIV